MKPRRARPGSLSPLGRVFLAGLIPLSALVILAGRVAETARAAPAAQPAAPGPEPAAGSGGELVGLGDLPGGDYFSEAWGVSADGRVVVGRSASRTAPGEAFRWTPAGGIEALGADSRSGALATSDRGEITVGWAMAADGGKRALLAEAGSPPRRLDAGSGSPLYATAWAVSAAGDVMVGARQSARGVEAFRWTAATGAVGLGDLPGGAFASQATCVSADGTIVAGWATSGEGRQAFRWSQEAGMIPLGDLPGGPFESRAFAISADGSVIVGSSRTESGTEVFRWTGPGTMESLGALPSKRSFSEPRGISADGRVIIGRSWSPLGFEGFIWRQGQGMRAIREVLEEELGVSTEGWWLTEALALSRDGTTVVGWGQHGEFVEAWRATIPRAPLGDR